MSEESAAAAAYGDHTLLVTTFNRPAFLNRLLMHLANDLPIGRVHVVDGSIEPFRTRNARVVSAFGTRIPVTLDQLEPGLPCIDHIIAAANLVATEFVTWCHDDNFVIAETLRASVAFLRANEDYVICSGQIVSIAEQERDTVVTVCNTCRVAQDSPFERFNQFLANHWNADFGTWRSRVFRKCADAQRLVPGDQTIGEPLPVALAALHGKLHVLPAPGALFVEHADRRSTASCARYGPSQAAFTEVVSEAARLVSTHCDDLRLACSGDPRDLVVGGYVRSLLKWSDNMNDGPQMRPTGAEPSVSIAAWHDVVALVERAIWAALARQGSDTGDRQQADRDAVRYPNPCEVFRVQGDVVRFAAIGALRDTADPLERSPAKPLPSQYDALVAVLTDPDWAAIYSGFRREYTEPVMGRLAGAADRDTLFDDAFQQALTNIARPLLDYAGDGLVGHVRETGLHDVESGVFSSVLDAVCLMQDYPHADLEVADAMPEKASRVFRILPDAPGADVDSWPFEITGGEVQRHGAITFVPLRIDPVLATRIADGHACWLQVDVAAVSGRVQLGLFRDGTVDALTPVGETGCPRTVNLQVAQSDYSFLIIRDLATGTERSQCSVSALRWRASIHPSVHVRDPADPRVLAA